MKPIEMISFSNCDGDIRPLRFKWMEGQDEPLIIKVDHVITVSEEKAAGTRMLNFSVQSFYDGEDHRFELRYESKSMMWYVSRM